MDIPNWQTKLKELEALQEQWGKQAERQYREFLTSQALYETYRLELTTYRHQLWREGKIEVDRWVSQQWHGISQGKNAYRLVERRKKTRGAV